MTAAAELLAERKAVVVLDNTLALRPDAHRILCEVIASDGIAPEEQVEMAKRLLQASTLGSVVSQDRHQWIVVRDYGTGTVELWRES